MAEYALEHGTPSVAVGAANQIIRAGHMVRAEEEKQRELQEIEIVGLEKQAAALGKLIDG